MRRVMVITMSGMMNDSAEIANDSVQELPFYDVIEVYHPLVRFANNVYYYPSKYGFLFYDAVNKTAALSPVVTMKIYVFYKNYVTKLLENKRDVEWCLPRKKLEVKKWTTSFVFYPSLFEAAEKEVFELMGYHYSLLGNPDEALLNVDRKMNILWYLQTKIQIEDERMQYVDKVIPRMYKDIKHVLSFLKRVKNEYLVPPAVNPF